MCIRNTLMTQSKKFEIILFSLRLKKTPWLTYFEELVTAMKKLSHQTFLENFYPGVVIRKYPSGLGFEEPVTTLEYYHITHFLKTSTKKSL